MKLQKEIVALINDRRHISINRFLSVKFHVGRIIYSDVELRIARGSADRDLRRILNETMQ